MCQYQRTLLWGAIIVAVVLLSLVVAGVGWAFAGPLLAIPLFVVIAGGALSTIVGGRSVLRTRRHHGRIRRFREQSRAQKQDFSSGDRRTLI